MCFREIETEKQGRAAGEKSRGVVTGIHDEDEVEGTEKPATSNRALEILQKC